MKLGGSRPAVSPKPKALFCWLVRTCIMGGDHVYIYTYIYIHMYLCKYMDIDIYVDMNTTIHVDVT